MAPEQETGREGRALERLARSHTEQPGGDGVGCVASRGPGSESMGVRGLKRYLGGNRKATERTK